MLFFIEFYFIKSSLFFKDSSFINRLNYCLISFYRFTIDLFIIRIIIIITIILIFGYYMDHYIYIWLLYGSLYLYLVYYMDHYIYIWFIIWIIISIFGLLYGSLYLYLVLL